MMLLSCNWLKDYIDIDMPISELADMLYMAGLPIEEVIEVKSGVTNVIASEITHIENHPNADKLSLCDVTDGKSTQRVVCGAKNIKTGQIVPLAKEGAMLAGGFRIKKAKIRGIESNGMICSAKELGIGDDSSGILVLDPAEYRPGNEFVTVRPDTILNLEITPNRPDLLCVTGLARFIRALTGKKFRKPECRVSGDFIGNSIDINKEIIIKNENPEKCPRYAARLIKGVKISASPAWLREKLSAVNIRPINNVVDITNYILFEMNHPLHAFDYDKLKGRKINIRDAASGEKITALDGRDYKLSPSDLVIADESSPVAIAGVMGGEHYSVSEKTENIVIESAFFLPSSVRKTSRSLGISSDSSYRFERGIDITGVENALNRACGLIARIAGGKISRNHIDIYPSPHKSASLKVRYKRVNAVLGTSLSKNDINGLIKSIGFEFKSGFAHAIVKVPAHRTDISGEIDIIEDIGQVYGYDNIPSTVPISPVTTGKESGMDGFTRSIRRIMMSYGFSEVVNYSFLNNKLLKNLKASSFEPENAVRIKNPFNEEETRLRTTLIPGLLKNLITNYNNENENIHLFEASGVFIKSKDGYSESKQLCGITYGSIINPSYLGKEFKTDFAYLKAAVESVCRLINTGERLNFELSRENSPFLEYTADIELGTAKIGVMGQVSEDILHEYKFREKAFIFELDIEKLYSIPGGPVKYSPISPYPVVKRDLSVIVDSDIPESGIESLIKKANPYLIKGLELYDLYRGEQVPIGSKSLTYSIIFQSDKKTLSETEINRAMESIIKELRAAVRAELRS